MKIVILLDDDGHFQASPLQNKFEVFKMIKDDLQGGDAWANGRDEVELNEVNYASATDEEFEAFVCHFVQRGLLEIATLPL